MRVVLATIQRKPLYVPLALWNLQSQLVQSGTLRREETSVAEFSEEWSERDILRVLMQAGPEVLGFSCYVWNINQTLRVCGLVKAIRPETKIILGGPEVGPRAEQVLRDHGCVDSVVDGEGEVTFTEIVAHLKTGSTNLAGIPGVVARDGEQIVVGPPRLPITDLDSIASPYLGMSRDLSGRDVCIETQRGCVFSCSFCFYSKGHAPASRTYSMERVIAEIDEIVRQKPRCIYLMDPVFNLRPARAKEITAYLAVVKPPEIRVHTEIWAEMVDEELARLMSEAHFGCLEVGLQSIDHGVLQATGRKTKIDRLADGVRLLNRFNLEVELHVMLGLPGDTRETILSSIDWAQAMGTRMLGIFPLLLLPGTKLRDEAESLGIRYDPRPPYTVISTPDIDTSEVLELERLGRAIEHLAMLQSVFRIRKETGFNLRELAEQWLRIPECDVPKPWRHPEARRALRGPLNDLVGPSESLRFYDQLLRAELG